MKRTVMRTTTAFLMAVVLALGVGWLLSYPLCYTISFTARGHQGDEMINLTKNWGTQTLIPEIALGKEWKEIRTETFFPVQNLQLHCSELSAEKYTTILFGVVLVQRRNLLGNLVDEEDWLNIKTKYLSPDGEPLFDETSKEMATIRSGVTGWTGYYQLVRD